MHIECAWCGADLGEKEPLADQSTSHSICARCSDEHLAGLVLRNQQMTNERFFRGFLATLKALDVSFIDTRDNDHHRRFAVVARAMHELDGWPIFVPTPLCGVYHEFDVALLVPRQCAPRQPHGVDLVITATTLDQFSAAERQTIMGLAHLFIGAVARDDDD